MGKGARLRRECASEDGPHASRNQRRRVAIADGRGRRVASTLARYEEIAALDPEGSRLIETLISRYTKRMDGLGRAPAGVRELMTTALAPIAHLDSVLLGFGAAERRSPANFGVEWPDHLMWAVDSCVAASRLLLSGQIVGAATLARHQMERWLLHRAFNMGVAQNPGESTIEYIARVWSVEDVFSLAWTSPLGADEGGSLPEPVEVVEPERDHAHITLSDGLEVCPPLIYGLLSEIMHGRMFGAAIEWESSGLLADPSSIPEDLPPAIGAVADAISLTLRQVRLALLTIAADRSDAAARSIIAFPLDRFTHVDAHTGLPYVGSRRVVTSGSTSSPSVALLAPLTPAEGLRDEFVAVVERMSGTFHEVRRGHRPAGRLFKDDELTSFAFAWHRSRSIASAVSALEQERRQLGDGFDERTIGHRTMRWIVLSEMTSLAGLWSHEAPQRSALGVVGSGIRSAYWLWLEDDDRSMAVLRAVFEQTARARVWRTKPTKAAKIESRGETRPRDWIEAAGWKRLSPLNRALGEFAHVKATSRWSAARELLAQFQVNADPDSAIYTARGAALELVTSLVADELLATVSEKSSVVGDVLACVLKRLDLLDDQGPEIRFNHIWSLRAAVFADSDFVINDTKVGS